MADNDSRRICPDCGLEPSHNKWQVAAVVAALPPVKEKPIEDPELHQASVKTRRHRKNTLLIVVLLWLGFMVFLVLLVLVARRFSGRETQTTAPNLEELQMQAQAVENRKLLRDHMPRIYRNFAAYAVSATNEQRSQFVQDPIRVSPRMVRYFSQNPMIRLELNRLERRASSVVALGESQAIGILWQTDDQVYETVFVQDSEGIWKMDWEHFVRYSDLLFSVFLAGGGQDEAEFRLLARERLAKERKYEPEISLTLYSPVVGKPREAGVASPEILVPRNSSIGKRLTTAFTMKSQGKWVFASQLPVIESDDLIRIRVRLRRTEDEDGNRRFEIVDLPACHWLGGENRVGVEIDEELPEENPAPEENPE